MTIASVSSPYLGLSSSTTSMANNPSTVESLPSSSFPFADREKEKDGLTHHRALSTPTTARNNMSNSNSATKSKSKDSCLEQIQLLEKNREERRRSMNERREKRAALEKKYAAQGTPGDVDFQKMIQDFRNGCSVGSEHDITGGINSPVKICIVIRKRPINAKEIRKKDYDSVTCIHPFVMVHDCKLKVDGITKYLDNTDFAFDHTFDEFDTSEDLYKYTTSPLIPFIFEKQGKATCFAYGQTGSGKTYTMTKIQAMAIRDIFTLLQSDPAYNNLCVFVSFFEIYGGKSQDLLNNRHKLNVREDRNGDIVIAGLEEMLAETEDDLFDIVNEGNRNRTTHATEVNDVSSRSHAICQITLRNRDNGKLHGKLSLIDLAGSERAVDSKHHTRQRRMESAEINKSLLALKECIRALDSEMTHVPYRASKLTMVLKDSFNKENSRTVMIATVSPGASSADHTLNTLRYADRVKEKTVHGIQRLQQGLASPTRSMRTNNNNLNVFEGGEEKNSLLGTPGGASRVPIKGINQLKSADRDKFSSGGQKSARRHYASRRGSFSNRLSTSNANTNDSEEDGLPPPPPPEQTPQEEEGNKKTTASALSKNKNNNDDNKKKNKNIKEKMSLADRENSKLQDYEDLENENFDDSLENSLYGNQLADDYEEDEKGKERQANRRVSQQCDEYKESYDDSNDKSTSNDANNENQRKSTSRSNGSSRNGKRERDKYNFFNLRRNQNKNMKADDEAELEKNKVDDKNTKVKSPTSINEMNKSSPMRTRQSNIPSKSRQNISANEPMKDGDALKGSKNKFNTNEIDSSSSSLNDSNEQNKSPGRNFADKNSKFSVKGKGSQDNEEDDLEILHRSLKKAHMEDEHEDNDELNVSDVKEFHRAVHNLFQDEEALLNLHMNAIQENAELLTKEGRLLQQIQGDDIVDYDIDHYANELEEILERKMDLMTHLRTQLTTFRKKLQAEEQASQKLASLPQY